MRTLDRLTVHTVPKRLRALPPLLTDLLIVVVVGVATASDAAGSDPGYRPADWFTWLLLAVSLGALVWRRRWPLPVAVVTGAACAGWALYGHIGELLNLPVLVAFYTVAVLGGRRRMLATGLAASLASGAVALTVGKDVANPQGLPVLEMLWPLVPLLLGTVVRTRRQLLAEYADRVARAEAEREREAERRVQAERVRIARELHDIVAHTVAAMTVQAEVALDAFEAKPELSRKAMRQVRDSGREAVRELRSTVTVLRDREDESTASAPGLDQLPDLVERFSGSDVEIALCRGREPGRAVLADGADRVPHRAGGTDQRGQALRGTTRGGLHRPAQRRPHGGDRGRRRQRPGEPVRWPSTIRPAAPGRGGSGPPASEEADYWRPRPGARLVRCRPRPP